MAAVPRGAPSLRPSPAKDPTHLRASAAGLLLARTLTKPTGRADRDAGSEYAWTPAPARRRLGHRGPNDLRWPGPPGCPSSPVAKFPARSVSCAGYGQVFVSLHPPQPLLHQGPSSARDPTAAKVTQNIDPPYETVLAQAPAAPPVDLAPSTADLPIEVAGAPARPPAKATSTAVSLDKTEAASPKAIEPPAVAQFPAQSYATATSIRRSASPISRWHDPVCVQVQGLAQTAEANQIKARIESVAQAVGLPAARAGCNVNVEIVFSDDPQRTMNDVANRRRGSAWRYHRRRDRDYG